MDMIGCSQILRAPVGVVIAYNPLGFTTDFSTEKPIGCPRDLMMQGAVDMDSSRLLHRQSVLQPRKYNSIEDLSLGDVRQRLQMHHDISNNSMCFFPISVRYAMQPH
jgi:hypothetical protein